MLQRRECKACFLQVESFVLILTSSWFQIGFGEKVRLFSGVCSQISRVTNHQYKVSRTSSLTARSRCLDCWKQLLTIKLPMRILGLSRRFTKLQIPYSW